MYIHVYNQERMSRRRSVELCIGGPKRAFNISQRQTRPYLDSVRYQQRAKWVIGIARYSCVYCIHC